MSLPKQKPMITVDKYLDWERNSKDRHIYLDGEIYAMAGESLFHGSISARLVAVLDYQLKGKPCQPFTKDTKVRSGPGLVGGEAVRGMFSYPDVVVVCGKPECHDEHKDIITNPTVIIEVLSPSTEAFDRGEKFTQYQLWNPTLKDYLLVSQDKPQIEHYSRRPEGTWSYQLHMGLTATVAIPSIDCTLNAAEVYERVEFGGD